MVEHFPSEYDVANGILESGSDLYGMGDVLSFLNSNYTLKDNGTRLICYFISLNMMKLERTSWIPSFLQWGDEYEKLMKKYFEQTYDNPAKAVGRDISKDLEEGVTRYFPWCYGIADFFQVDRSFVEDARVRIKRMLAAYAIEKLVGEIHKQDIMFAIYCYMIAFYFGHKTGLQHFFAEAIGFKLFIHIESIVTYNQKLMDIKYLEKHFKEVDDVMKNFAPQARNKIAQSQLDFNQVILHWENTLFTNEHIPANLLLLWDHIFFHVGEFHFFMKFVVVAHVRFMEENNVDYSDPKSIENVPWNVVKILQDCDKIMEDDLFRVKFNFWKLIPCYNCCPALWKYGRS